MSQNKQNIIFKNTQCIEKEILIEYARGKINAKDIHKVEYHLIDCKFCNEALEGYDIGKNIKLEVYDMKLQVLRLSEQSSMHKVIRLLNANKATLKVAAALVLFLGIIGLMIKAVSSLSMKEPSYAENKEVILKDADKIDHTIEVTPKIEKSDLKEIAANQDIVEEQVQEDASIEEPQEIDVDQSIPEEVADLEQVSKEEESSFELEIVEEDNDDLAEFNSGINDVQDSNEDPGVALENPRAKKATAPEASNAIKGSSEARIKSGLSRIEAITEMRKLTDAQNYNVLILTYKAYESMINDDVEILFYVASAYNYTNELEQSILMHQRVIGINDPYYKVESKWQLANIYLAKEEKDKAANLLEDLIRSNSRYKKAAQDIRKTLGD